MVSITATDTTAFGHSLAPYINAIPGIKFENQFVSPALFARNKWDTRGEIALQLPIAILPVRATTRSTWFLLGVIRAAVWLTVFFTVTWWAILLSTFMASLTERVTTT